MGNVKSKSRTIVALRHTAVGIRPGVCYGQIDIPLADSYRDELETVRRRFVHPDFGRIISSPLQRCHRLATDLGLGPVRKDPRLMELSFGQWEGLLWADIPRDISEYWTADVVNRAPPGGESFQDLITRVQAAIEDDELWAAGSKVLLVTHAGVIRALHHILKGVEPNSSLSVPISFGESHAFTF